MAERSHSFWPAVTLCVAGVSVLLALPESWKQWAPSFARPALHLGLDLAGGTQLDFRISEREIAERIQALETEIDALERSGATNDLIAKQNELLSLQEQERNLTEAIRTVLERRINALGVSEATITPSYFGEEKHLLVDCPGVIDTQECIDTVGKTIRLEFKEEFTEATDEYKATVRTRAEQTFAAIQSGSGTLQTHGEDLSGQLGIGYQDEAKYFQNELPDAIADLWTRAPGSPAVIRDGTLETPRPDAEGQYQLVEIEGIFIAEVVDSPVPVERTILNPPDALQELQTRAAGSRYQSFLQEPLTSLSGPLAQELLTATIGNIFISTATDAPSLIYLAGRTEGTARMDVSHILVSYAGASQAEASVTRTREEALERADNLKIRLTNGENFANLARGESDGPSAAQGGSLGTIARGDVAPAFETAAFGLQQGGISDVVETEFGFHIIRADSSPRLEGAAVSYDILTLAGADAETQAQNFLTLLVNDAVQVTEDQITLRVVFFSMEPTGWKDTELTGEYFRSASVTVDTFTNVPVVQIQFDSEGARIFEELTARNIGKSIAIFVGGELISAPTVQQRIAGGTAVITGVGSFEEAKLLAQDLNTGAIPAPIHLSGQRTIEATLGADALRSSVTAGMIGIVLLILFMISVYRILGAVAGVTLLFYLVLLVTLMKLPLFLVTDQYIVLTLAGIAGIILSLGMAVDANVLIFERMKEELRKGKPLSIAAETGFKRAWPSIRDGNVSTLITCAILFMIGTSIVRGFAITLSLGIVLSLFTAIVVTRWLIERIAQSPLAQRTELFAGGKRE